MDANLFFLKYYIAYASVFSCPNSNVRFIRGKSWKIRLFPKPVGEIAKTSILRTTCFKQFLCSSRLASSFGKSFSAVFVASSNSAWRDIESVITAIAFHSVKNSYKHSRTFLPSPPLLFIAFFTSHRSPLSERLEQAKVLRPTIIYVS